MATTWITVTELNVNAAENGCTVGEVLADLQRAGGDIRVVDEETAKRVNNAQGDEQSWTNYADMMKEMGSSAVLDYLVYAARDEAAAPTMSGRTMAGRMVRICKAELLSRIG